MKKRKWIAGFLGLAMLLPVPAVNPAANVIHVNAATVNAGTQAAAGYNDSGIGEAAQDTDISVGNTGTEAITLVNIAAQCTIAVEAEQNGKEKENMVDGSTSTLWVKDKGGFPTTASFALPTNAGKVKKVVAKFESGHPTWSVDLSLSVDSQEEHTKTAHNFDDIYEYEFSAAVAAEEIALTLSNPINNGAVGTFWPALAEVEIWAEAAALIDVTDQAVITVPSKSEDASKMVDDNTSTMWVAAGGNWPANIDFELPGNLLVGKVEIDFEKTADQTARTKNIQLSSTINRVTSDYQPLLDAAVTHNLNDTFIYTPATVSRMSNLRITLSSPSPSTLWPAIAEVRIYAVDENVPLEDYDNIAAYGDITSVGGSHNEADKGKLTDEDYATAYEFSPNSFAGLASGESAWVSLDFLGNQTVAGFEVAFAQPGGTGNGATFTYNILGKTSLASEWTTYVSGATATCAGDTWKNQHKLSILTGMRQVRIEITNCSDTALKPTLSEIKVFGEYSEPVTDTDSAAWTKPVHANFSAGTAYLVNDGDTNTSWQADMYPAYVDIDLEENYNISEIQVYTPTTGYSQYGIYTSLDGRDFTLFGEKQDKEACPANGIAHTADGETEARIVRIYLEYYSQSTRPSLREVRVTGTPTKTQVQTAPAVDIPDFEGSEYDITPTAEHAIEEVKGIISRNVGQNYVNWFSFEIAQQDNGYDYFTLSNDNGKIKVTGNNGVSLATGVNHYLKYFCNVHISQVGSQIAMPAAVVPVDATIHKETKYPVRYAYNYCTHSYSMSFWGEEEWQKEIDWLALNGVNLVLDIAGQEEVWRRFLMDLGYSHQEAKDFLAGPAYYAWAYMANLTGFGGPIHDTWLEERVDMARSNHLRMRKLGMNVVLQGYSGMVPVDLITKKPELSSNIIPQGNWCSFRRPDMLRTNTTVYDEYAALFYQAQEEVFGNITRYYATDPFHEGGITGGMDSATVYSSLLDSLIGYDSDAVWVIQYWQQNPTVAAFNGLMQPTDRRDHALILDLYAEKSPAWRSWGTDTDGDGLKEFTDTPWVYCQLNNFGGRMGLHGHLDNLAANIPAAANESKHMAGIGITPEASQNNPVLYDFLFETIWTDDAGQPLEAIDLEQWLADYVTRRYGAENADAIEAMNILANTVYKASLNMKGQGAPESVINARPSLSINAASTWGNAIIDYDKTDLEEAARLLLAEYDALSSSDAYLYDLADILKQILSNTAQEIHKDMAAAYQARDLEAFTAASDKFLALIAMNEKVLATRQEFLFGTWTTNASELAANADEFTQNLYLLNAKAIVTTWGSYDQCNTGRLKDYSNRQWAGLTNDYYKARWEMWIEECKKVLNGQQANLPDFNWFEWEWAYARSNNPYSNVASGESLKTLGEQVLENFASPPPGPEATDDNDIDPATMTATAGSAQGGEGAERVLDNDTGTLWHSAYGGVEEADRWITIDLGTVKLVNGLRYLPRQSGINGIITAYRVDISTDGNTWTEGVASGNWANDTSWKGAFFDAVDARYVRLFAVESAANGSTPFVSAAEIRITTPPAITGVRVSPESQTVPLGGTAQFTAEVTGTGAFDTEVDWTVEGMTSAGTTINATGRLTVGADETATALTVKATAKGNSSISHSVTVQVTAAAAPTITSVAVSPGGQTVQAGGTLQFSAEVNGTGSFSHEVEWTVAGAMSNSTKISASGLLTVGADETAETLTVKATAKGDAGISGSVTVTVTAAVNPPGAPTITGVSISPDKKTIAAGGSASFTATVTGTGNYDKTVSWTISGAKSSSTKISAAGLLSVGKDETATALTVTATAKGNAKISDSITVTITASVNPPGAPTITGISISPEKKTIAAGGSASFTATVTGTGNYDKTVSWTISGAKSSSTKISAAGLLSVGKDETAQTLTVKATANGNSSVSATAAVTVTPDSSGSNGGNDKPFPFTDVPVIEGHWKYTSVKYVYDNGIMNGIAGTNLFDPDSPLTRAMFVTVLYRMADQPAVEFENKFSDVADGKYYSQAIIWANKQGIVDGFQDGTYGVEVSITREQIAKMLNEYAKKQNYDVSGMASLDSFTDKDSVSHWAVGYIQWAVDAGMISGKPNDDQISFRLDPKGNATRAECAKMLKMFMEKYQPK